MKDIVILGSGGFAKEVLFLIEEINRNQPIWNFLGFIDKTVGEKIGYKEVIGDDDYLIDIDKTLHVAFGIGNPAVLRGLSLKLSQNHHLQFPNLIHPNVIGNWKAIDLGQGNIICSSNTFTTNITIGDYNIINLDCTVGHDTVIGNCNVINPSVNISGGVTLKDECLLGTNSVILQNLQVESKVVIGASGLVTKDILEQGVYVGAPVTKIN